MNWTIKQSQNLNGSVVVPPNKSQSFRALIFAALAEGQSTIFDPALSADWHLGVQALQKMGAQITPLPDNVYKIQGVAGQLKTPDDIIDCGNSGILLRFLSAVATHCPGYAVFTGDNSLRNIRPMKPLIDALNQLGATAISTKNDGKAPVIIRGKIQGGTAKIAGQDSQPVSATLVAASLAPNPTDLQVTDPGEKPWVDMTLSWLDKMGVDYENNAYARYHISGQNSWSGFEYHVPRDWSSVLYPIVAALLIPNSEIKIPNVCFEDPQGDKLVIDQLIQMGANIETGDDFIIARSSELTGAEIDCNKFIDQLPLLALVGTAASGQTKLFNAEICREKECDRIAASCEMLTALGADISEQPGGLVIKQSKLIGAKLKSYHDHRMVFVGALAGLIARGQTTISDTDCVSKTFANFKFEMQKVGAQISEED